MRIGTPGFARVGVGVGVVVGSLVATGVDVSDGTAVLLGSAVASKAPDTKASLWGVGVVAGDPASFSRATGRGRILSCPCRSTAKASAATNRLVAPTSRRKLPKRRIPLTGSLAYCFSSLMA